jgi:hypothetical protein
VKAGSSQLPSQQDFALALARRLGLSAGSAPLDSIRRLQANGIAPETGWYAQGPATDVFVALMQKSLLDRMGEAARRSGATVPVTLGLLVQTPGRISGQSFAPPAADAKSSGIPASALEKLKTAGTAAVQIDSPHPFPAGDGTIPVVWSYRVRHPGAAFIRLHFERIEINEPDRIVVVDRFGRPVWQSGSAMDVWAPRAEGDTAVLLLVADGQDQGWGIKIDRYDYGDAPSK